MKYQIGEVIRFADTPNNATAGLVGKLATITNYGGIEREWYQTVVTGDKWFPSSEFESVNGGIPKHRYNFLSDKESVFNSIDLCAMSVDGLLRLQDEVASAIEAHDQAIRKRRIQLLHEAINALDACMVDAVLADAAFYFSDADLHAYSIADMSGVLVAELDAIDK